MDYQTNLRKNLAAFIISRLVPYLGITFILAFQAHQSFADLSILAYVLATYAVPVSLLSMTLAVVGNLLALNGENLPKNRQLFQSGLYVAAVLAITTFLINLAIHFFWIDKAAIANLDPLKLSSVSLIYLLSTPLLVINTFLFFFNEAYRRASSSTTIKSAATVAATGIVLTGFYGSGSSDFSYFAGAFFVVLEALTTAQYIYLSRRRGFSFRPRFSPSVFRDMLAMGIPVAAGLGVQKLYFLLLTDRLIRIDSAMVSLLSVSMSIIGFLMIPVAAFSQLHSLYIGKNLGALRRHSRIGTTYLVGLIAMLAVFFYLLSQDFYRLFASSKSAFPLNLAPAIVCLFFASSLINFSMGQLRALKDTLVPQAITGLVLLLALYPLIASRCFDNASLATFLYAESAALLLCYGALRYRTYQMERRQ